MHFNSFNKFEFLAIMHFAVVSIILLLTAMPHTSVAMAARIREMQQIDVKEPEQCTIDQLIVLLGFMIDFLNTLTVSANRGLFYQYVPPETRRQIANKVLLVVVARVRQLIAYSVVLFGVRFRNKIPV